jgi:hypothetical protein
MQAIALDTLVTVTGGYTSTSLTISSSGNTNNQSNSLLLPVMMLALSNRRQQPSIVSTPGTTVVSY